MSIAISIQCPHCQVTLKLKNRKAIGKKLPCPKCKQPFVVKPLSEDEDDFVGNVDSFDEDYGEPEGNGGNSPSPVLGRRSTLKKSKTKSSVKRSKSPGWQKPALITGGSLLGIGVLVGLVWLAVGALSGPRIDDRLDLAYLPPNSEVIVSIRIADFLNAPILKSLVNKPEVQQNIDEMRKKIGLEPADVESVIFGVPGVSERQKQSARQKKELAGGPSIPLPDFDDLPGIIVIRTSKAINKQKLVDYAEKAEEIPIDKIETVSHAGETYYRIPNPGEGGPKSAGVFFPNDNTIVVGPEKDVKSAIERGSKGETRPDLDFINLDQDFLIAFVPKDRSAFAEQSPIPRDDASEAERNLEQALQEALKGFSFGLTLTDGIDFQLQFDCLDSDWSEQIKTHLDVVLNETLKEGRQKLAETKKELADSEKDTSPVWMELVELAETVIDNVNAEQSKSTVVVRAAVPGSAGSTLAKIPQAIADVWSQPPFGVPNAGAEITFTDQLPQSPDFSSVQPPGSGTPGRDFEVPVGEGGSDDSANTPTDVAEKSIEQPEEVDNTQPRPAAPNGKDDLQKDILLSYNAPFGLFVPDDIHPLFVTLELTGQAAEKATAYGFLRIKPLKDDQGKVLEPVKSKFSFGDPAREFVDLDPFSRDEGVLKITMMYAPPSETATQLASVEGSLQLKENERAQPVAVQFQFENVALSGGDGNVKLQSPSNHGGFFSFAFSPDGKTVAGGTGVIRDGDTGKLHGGGEVVLWNSGTGRLQKTLGSHKEGVDWIAYSSDGTTLSSASKKNGLIKFWNMPAGRPKKSWKAPVADGEWQKLILAPDGNSIVAVVKHPTKDGKSLRYQTALWNAATGKETWKLPVSNSAAVAISPDGSRIAAHVVKSANRKTTSNELLLCNSQTGDVVKTIDLGKDSPRDGLAFLADGKQIAGLTYRGLQLWDIESDELVKTVSLTPDADYKSINLSRDGQSAVLPQFMGKAVEVWNLRTGEPKGKLSFEFPNNIHNPFFSGDLTRMAGDQGQQGPVVIAITDLEPLSVPKPKTRTVRNKPTTGKRNADRPQGQRPSRNTTRPNRGKPVPLVDLVKSAKYSASSHRRGEEFATAKAFDGNPATHWSSHDGAARGAWLAARWERPVTIHKLIIRQSHDRITDFVVQRFDTIENDWVDLMYVFGNRHSSSYSRKGEKMGWGYRPNAVWVDGKRLGDSKERVFGSHPLGSVHPVFTINLPDPLTANGIRVFVRNTKGKSVGVYEMEIAGTKNASPNRPPQHASGNRPPLEKIHRKPEFAKTVSRNSIPVSRQLFHAISEGDVSSVKALLKRSPGLINRKSSDKQKNSFLHFAAGRGHKEIVQLILSKGVDVNIANKNGGTPLHRAAYMGHKDVVAVLLENGADVKFENKRGKTAEGLAAQKGHAKVVDLLKTHQSKTGNSSAR